MYWQTIKSILDDHDYPDFATGSMTNFLSTVCDYHQKISKIFLDLINNLYRDCCKTKEGD